MLFFFFILFVSLSKNLRRFSNWDDFNWSRFFLVEEDDIVWDGNLRGIFAFYGIYFKRI